MNSCFASGHDSSMVGNFDATQFKVTFTNDERLVVFVENKDIEEPVSIVGESTMDIFIKYIHLCVASGRVGKAVFLVADPGMSNEDLSVSEISGLSTSTEPGSKGYLCFCKSRVGNFAFYKWFITVVLVEFVALLRGTLSEEDSDQSFFLTCDGEDTQIAVFQDDEVNAILIANRIDDGKGCAS